MQWRHIFLIFTSFARICICYYWHVSALKMPTVEQWNVKDIESLFCVTYILNRSIRHSSFAVTYMYIWKPLGLSCLFALNFCWEVHYFTFCLHSFIYNTKHTQYLSFSNEFSVCNRKTKKTRAQRVRNTQRTSHHQFYICAFLKNVFRYSWCNHGFPYPSAVPYRTTSFINAFSFRSQAWFIKKAAMTSYVQKIQTNPWISYHINAAFFSSSNFLSFRRL